MSAPLNQTMLALTLERHPSGLQVDKVPPHITVLPWFAMQGPDVEYVINSSCEQTDPFMVYPKELGEVGSNGHVKKALFLESPELQKFHKRLFLRLSDVDVTFPYPEWLGDNYNPHIRVKSEQKEIPETGISFSSLSIIRNARLARDGIAKKTITHRKFGKA